MSLSEPGLGRLARGALAFALVALLASCQVRPLYATGEDMKGTLGSIAFSDAEDRVGQEVRNSLIFMAGGGAGEPADPAYMVEMKVKTRTIGVLLDMSTDLPGAGRVEVSADYSLSRSSDGTVLKTGRRAAVATVDFPGQEFARMRAIRDAENRAARELAELIRADLAAALGR